MTPLLALVLAANLAAPPSLTDAALVAGVVGYKTGQWPPDGTRIIGLHHGIRVVADSSCSDVCPGNTVTVIHYDLAPGPDCRRAHGVDATALVPMSIAMVPRHFCVPEILVREKLFRFNP